MNRKDIRFVIDNSILERLNVKPKHDILIDYYINQNNRIRYIKESSSSIMKDGNFYEISVPPGCVYKYPKLLDENDAKKIACWKNTNFIVRKTIIGLLNENFGNTNNLEGYVEKVIAEKIIFNGSSKYGVKIFEELHMEIKANTYDSDCIKNIIKPIHTLENGMYNYVENKWKLMEKNRK